VRGVRYETLQMHRPKDRPALYVPPAATKPARRANLIPNQMWKKTRAHPMPNVREQRVPCGIPRAAASATSLTACSVVAFVADPPPPVHQESTVQVRGTPHGPASTSANDRRWVGPTAPLAAPLGNDSSPAAAVGGASTCSVSTMPTKSCRRCDTCPRQPLETAVCTQSGANSQSPPPSRESEQAPRNSAAGNQMKTRAKKAEGQLS